MLSITTLLVAARVFVSVFLQTSPLRYTIYCYTTFLWLLSLHKKSSFPLRTGSYSIKTAASVHKF